MVFDIEEYDANKMKLLGALLDGENGVFIPEKKVSIGQDFTAQLRDISNYAKLSHEDPVRMVGDLIQEKMLASRGGFGMSQLCCLTREGRNKIDRHLYEKSFRAKRRKLIKLAKDGGIILSKKAFAGLCSLIAGLGIFATFKEQIIRWLKVHLKLQ